MNIQQAKELLEKYNQGTASQEEILQVENWYAFESQHQQSIPPDQQEDYPEILSQIWNDIQRQKYKAKRTILWPRIAAAAAILLIASLGIIFYTYYFAPRHPEGSAATKDLLANDIKPGTNKATLTLANGQQITLNDAANGTIANQSGIKITKTANGQLVYEITSSNHPASLAPSGRGGKAGEGEEKLTNTISTPRGGQYQIHLPDGTHVWLNASSTLKYPITFTGSPDRKVSLTGEAYFEVAKDKAHPFKVTSSTQEVTVLGTHFNINTYPDEPDTKTTLLEGSVKVSTLHPSPLRGEVAKPVRGEQLTLKPNQQATLKSGAIQVKTVNASDAIAWKNGLLAFQNAPLESVMRQISRWYDVQIEYTDPALKSKTFSGSLSKYDQVSRILNTISFTGIVKFKIEGKKIIVTK